MMRRRSRNIAAALATLVAPLAALAQGLTGSVTTIPVHQVPALGVWLIVVLAVAMAGAAMHRLRRTASGAIVGILLVAALTVLAGLGYASSGVTISGAGCVQQTISTFSPLDPNKLMSDCPNPIQIVDIEVGCGEHSAPNSQPNVDGASGCRVGQILIKGGACRLPQCF